MQCQLHNLVYIVVILVVAGEWIEKRRRDAKQLLIIGIDRENKMDG